jgi:hypothetical protein
VNDPCWTPPDAKGVVGDWWEDYARRHKLTWEIGQPLSYDARGKWYDTLTWCGVHGEGAPEICFFGTLAELLDKFEKSMDEFLGTDTHVVWRRFPHLTQTRRNALELRARLCSYPEKP